MLSLIAAMANERVIGKDNTMPWRMPADLAWFKRNTLNKPIVMGRKTWDSLGKALPQRRNIVLTRQHDLVLEGADIMHDPEAILKLAEQQEVMIIGGGDIYALFMPFAERLYLTTIEADITGDTWFPAYDSAQWQQDFTEHHLADAKHDHNYSFHIFNAINRD